ncbi:hypothetical protein YC2023_053670 [Brassica napus]
MRIENISKPRSVLILSTVESCHLNFGLFHKWYKNISCYFKNATYLLKLNQLLLINLTSTRNRFTKPSWVFEDIRSQVSVVEKEILQEIETSRSAIARVEKYTSKLQYRSPYTSMTEDIL